MKILNFGSLNIDKVYHLKDFVHPGETVMAADCQSCAGGKGLNQSLAACHAGAEVIHAGAVGEDGSFLTDLLADAGVNTDYVSHLEGPNGHAIIQVNESGQNCIIVFGGSNRLLTKEYIDTLLLKGVPGDIVLLQNEINAISYIMEEAHARKMSVAFNPSPIPQNPDALPLSAVDYFIVNEIEGAFLAGLHQDSPSGDVILNALSARFPASRILLTLGAQGALYQDGANVYRHDIFPVKAVDTTAAGDTFCGYFLAGICRGEAPEVCLAEASAASAIAVSRAGAAPSIPARREVLDFLAKHK